MKPLGRKLYVEVDPDPTESKGGIAYPEVDFLEYCPRCSKHTQQLDGPCVGRDDYKLDLRLDRLNFKGTDYSHDRQRAVWPASLRTPEAVCATVLAIGKHVRSVRKGDRILISRSAGGNQGAVRTIWEEEVMAEVEE